MAAPGPPPAPCAQIPSLPRAAAPSLAAPARMPARPSVAATPCIREIASLRACRLLQTLLAAAIPIPMDVRPPEAPFRLGRPCDAQTPECATASHFAWDRAGSG